MTVSNGLVLRKCNLPTVVNDNSLVAYFEKIKEYKEKLKPTKTTTRKDEKKQCAKQNKQNNSSN